MIDSAAFVVEMQPAPEATVWASSGPFLFQFSTTENSYVLYMTDYKLLWKEYLDKKSIIARATDCSSIINPNLQLKLLLQTLRQFWTSPAIDISLNQRHIDYEVVASLILPEDRLFKWKFLPKSEPIDLSTLVYSLFSFSSILLQNLALTKKLLLDKHFHLVNLRLKVEGWGGKYDPHARLDGMKQVNDVELVHSSAVNCIPTVLSAMNKISPGCTFGEFLETDKASFRSQTTERVDEIYVNDDQDQDQLADMRRRRLKERATVTVKRRRL